MAEDSISRKSRLSGVPTGTKRDEDDVEIRKEGTLTVATKGVILKSKKAPVKVVLTSTSITWLKKTLRKKKPDSVPLSLVWLRDKVDAEHINDDADGSSECSGSYAFALHVPECILVLYAKSDSEKNEWIKEIRSAQRAAIKNDDSAIRKGKYTFNIGGTYEGEWINGKPHGKGKYVAPDGTIYDGDWHADLGVGYGEITVILSERESDKPETVRYKSGWEFDFMRYGVREVKSDVFGPEDTLTDKDYKFLMTGATNLTFKKGDIIKHEGDVNDSLYRIKSGKISLRKEMYGTERILAEMGENAIFGEMSILDKNIISATIVAESEKVELECVQLDFLYGIFKTNPGLSKRFHQSIACTLAERLKKILPTVDSSNKEEHRKLRTTFSGLLIPQKNENKPEVQFAKKWVKVWNQNDPKQTGYLSTDIKYRDPFVPNGIVGRQEVAKHKQALRQRVKRWDWEEPFEYFPFDDGFTMRCKARLLMNNGQSLVETSLTLATLNSARDLITRLEIFFDTSSLKKSEEEGDSAKAASPEQPPKRKLRDIKFCERFNLSGEESIIREFSCVLVGANVNGKLYFSQHVFGLKTKEVTLLKQIKNCKKKSPTMLDFRYKAKGRGPVAIEGLAKMKFIFPTSFECDEALSTYMTLSKQDDTPKDENLTEGKVTTNETYFEKYVRCSTLHLSLPEAKVVHPSSDKSIRLVAPLGYRDDTFDSFGSDVAIRVTSTYPHLSTKGNDGAVIVQPNARQGDPICDQICVERFENATIMALADGCNWGEKPRKAAHIASRTFVDFVKRNQCHTVTAQDAGSLFLQAFVQAHQRILEGHEEEWWEVGTTTIIGGALVQLTDPYHPWAFVCASVGDCKAYRISRRNRTVTEITQGRTGNAAKDASDCGGRIGPFKDGNPDLRNLSLFFHYVDEGDIVMLTSDGVYDNLDPQSLGVSPRELGIDSDDWKTAPGEAVEEVKSRYSCEVLERIIFGESNNNEDEEALLELDPASVVNKVVEYAIATTASTREFMEQNPDKKLPSDYTKYPGKVDHTSCACVKVGKTSFKDIEQTLDGLIIRMRHPVTGISAMPPIPTAQEAQLGALASIAVLGNDKAKLRREQTSLLNIRGSVIQRWLEEYETKDMDRVNFICQSLLNFRYIRPLEIDSWRTETFLPDMKYKFQVYEPILSRNDWELILKGAKRMEFKKDECIVREGDKSKPRIYYIVSGTCRIEKSVAKSESEGEVTKKERKEKSKNAASSKPPVALNALHESETFGEISFLFNSPASASVIADTELVEVCVIEGRFVKLLFVKYPHLAGRFYHYLASVLARRIKRQESKQFSS